MLQQCKASCETFAEENQGILQDTSDTCVNFALQGGCDTDLHKATTICRASCHIQRICANHTENVLCAKARHCEARTLTLTLTRARARTRTRSRTRTQTLFLTLSRPCTRSSA